MTNIIHRLLLFNLIFTPLAFGTVEQWSLTIMEVSFYVALTVFFFIIVRDKETSLYKVPGILPLSLFLAYMLLQLVPLPHQIIRFISPETYSLYRESIWIDRPAGWAALSINRKATLTEFFRVLSYASCYILTVQLLVGKEYLKKTVSVITVFVSLLSLFGILQNILPNNKIFWMRELTQGGTPFGPYVNRNHYAGLISMVFPISLSLFLYYKPKMHYASFRERMSELFNQRLTNISVLLGSSVLLIALSIFLSHSRGGIVSLSLSMIFFGIIILLKEKKAQRGIVIILIFVVILYSVGWFGWDPIFERFEKIRNESGDIVESRLDLWKESVQITRDFPLTGTGHGSFISIYPKYRSVYFNAVVDHAHNDYLELFIEGGVISFSLFCWFLLSVLRSSYHAYGKRRDTYAVYLAAGAFAGIISMLIHSLTDFNLHIGANGLYFFFLMGLAVSSAHTRYHDEEGQTYLKKIAFPYAEKAFIGAALVTIVGFVFNAGIITGAFLFASSDGKNIDTQTPKKELQAIRDKAARASFCDPLEARYPYTVAHAERLLAFTERSQNYYKKALFLDPVNGEYLQIFGLLLSDFKRYDIAERYLRSGINLDKGNAIRYRIYALWLLSQNRKKEGLENIKTAISLDPRHTKDYLAMMAINGISDSEMKQTIPAKAGPYFLYADYLLKTGNEEMGDKAYRDALAYSENEKDIARSFFLEAYSFYRKKKEYDRALLTMQKAAEKYPADITIRLMTASAYAEAGITYKAIEEYKRVLILDPDNTTARRKIREIDK